MSNSANDKWEWSEKHTRLRFQLLIITLIFAGACHLGISKVSIPGSSIEFSKKAPELFILLIMGCFSIYTFVSFVVRSNNERNDLGVFLSPIEVKLDEISNQLTIDLPDIQVDFTYMYDSFLGLPKAPQKELEGINNTLKSGLRRWRGFEDEINNVTKHRDELIKLNAEIVKALKPSFSVATQEYDEKTQWEITNREAGKYQYFLSRWPQFSEDLVEEFRPRDIKVAMQQINDMSISFRDLPENVAKTEMLVKRAEEVVKIYREEILSNEGVLGRFNESVKKLREAIEKQRNGQRIERELLGYFMPAAISVFLFWWGICGVLSSQT